MFTISWFSDTPVQGAESHRTENPLVHLDGLEIKCSVFVVLCLKPCPAQYGTAKHGRESCPSLFSCKSFFHLFLCCTFCPTCCVPPHCLSSSAKTAERAVFVPGPFVPRAFPRRARGSRGSSAAPLRAAWHTRQRHNAACAGCGGVSGQPDSARPRTGNRGRTLRSSEKRLGQGSSAGRAVRARAGRAAVAGSEQPRRHLTRPDTPSPAEEPHRPLSSQPATAGAA